MKKVAYILGIAAIVVGCQEAKVETANPVIGESYQIEALIPGTKTTFTPPLAVAWESTDELAVIVQADGSQNTYKFIKSFGTDNNIFECEGFTPPAAGSVYQLIYQSPYVGDMTIDVEGNTATAITVGSAFDGYQTQKGIGTGVQEHIKAPLVGYMIVGENASFPSIAMNHVTTLLDVQVTNNTTNPITITKISIEAGESSPLVGSFYAKPSTGTLTAVPEGTSNTALLNVESGEIPAGGIGNFYLVTAPFTVLRGQSITITVTTADGSEETIKSPDTDRTFAAGTVNHLQTSFNPTQIKITSATASSDYATTNSTNAYQGSYSPDLMIDGNKAGSSSYQSPWANNQSYFPISLVFTLEAPQTVDLVSMFVDTGGNGRPGVCDIYYTTAAAIDGTEAWNKITPPSDSQYKNETVNESDAQDNGLWDFGQTTGTFEFDLGITEAPTAIKFEFKYGSNGYLVITEMEFYTYSSATSSESASDSTEENTLTSNWL